MSHLDNLLFTVEGIECIRLWVACDNLARNDGFPSRMAREGRGLPRIPVEANRNVSLAVLLWAEPYRHSGVRKHKTFPLHQPLSPPKYPQGTLPPGVVVPINTTCTLAIATLAVKIWIRVAVVKSARQLLNRPLHKTMKTSLLTGDVM